VTTGLNALAVGILVGLTFGFTRLPVPAPPSLAGVMGVVGITVGWQVAVWIAGRF
jgi:XapX domain-containing protein